jgi:DNA polymerase sigma
MDTRARELILLVKRWAKDRGICHAAKGHLSPYAWSLLCIFFLQAGMTDDESILPSLAGFKKASKLARLSPSEQPPQPTGSRKSTAALFADFISFYHETFDWKTEAVSLRSGRRGQPGLALPLHIIVSEDGKTTSVGPSIEDPFDDGHNLGSGMSSPSLARLFEELARAGDICSKAVSLAELLEPWAPTAEQEHESSDNRDEGKSAPDAVGTAPWRARTA